MCRCGRAAGRLQVYQAASGLLCTADAHPPLLPLLLPPSSRAYQKNSLPYNFINSSDHPSTLQVHYITLFHPPVGRPGKKERQVRDVEPIKAIIRFTSLSITGAGVAAAVHQRFLHDLQAAECVGPRTRQRPPTSISCRAASMVSVAAEA